jgi:hypothetical protein
LQVAQEDTEIQLQDQHPMVVEEEQVMLLQDQHLLMEPLIQVEVEEVHNHIQYLAQEVQV